MTKKDKKSSNIDNSSIFGTTNPYEISNEEVRKRRAARENREDMQAAFGTGY